MDSARRIGHSPHMRDVAAGRIFKAARERWGIQEDLAELLAGEPGETAKVSSIVKWLGRVESGSIPNERTRYRKALELVGLSEPALLVLADVLAEVSAKLDHVLDLLARIRPSMDEGQAVTDRAARRLGSEQSSG